MIRYPPIRRLARACFLVSGLTLGMAVLAPATPAAAQDAHGFGVVAGLGYEMGGPGPSLASALTAQGMGDRHMAGSGEVTQYPLYYDAGIGLAVFLGGHYQFRGPYSVDFLVSNGSRGHAEGYSNSGPDRLLIRWSSGMLTATAGVHLGPVRLAAGPTVNMIFWDMERNWAPQPALTTPLLGATALATARIPARDAVVSLSAGVRAFGRADLSDALGLPITAQYDTWFVGLTVSPRPQRY